MNAMFDLRITDEELSIIHSALATYAGGRSAKARDVIETLDVQQNEARNNYGEGQL